MLKICKNCQRLFPKKKTISRERWKTVECCSFACGMKHRGKKHKPLMPPMPPMLGEWHLKLSTDWLRRAL